MNIIGKQTKNKQNKQTTNKQNKQLNWADFNWTQLNWTESNEIEFAVQVNGKLRGSLKVNLDENKEIIIDKAKKIENVEKFLSSYEILKVIFVEKKLINFVIKWSFTCQFYFLYY